MDNGDTSKKHKKRLSSYHDFEIEPGDRRTDSGALVIEFHFHLFGTELYKKVAILNCIVTKV